MKVMSRAMQWRSRGAWGSSPLDIDRSPVLSAFQFNYLLPKTVGKEGTAERLYEFYEMSTA